MFAIDAGEGVELRLRPLEAAEAIFRQIDQDRERLGRYLDWVEKTETVADTAAYLQKSLDDFEKGTSVSLGIWFDDQWVGSIGLHEFDPVKGTCEIGYWICPGYEGQGIVSRSVAALVSYAFRERGMHLVKLRCDITNGRSEAVARRMGFQLTEVAEHQPAVYASVEQEMRFVLTRDDWELSG